MWRLVPVPYLDASGAGFNIIAAHSRKCLDESSVGTVLGATISQFECIGGSENQIWDLVLVNSSPVAVDDVFEVAFETTGTLNVLNNDFDPDADPILITDIPRNGSNGTAILSADSTMILYTPSSGFLGTDNFDYQVSDFFEGAPLGGSGVATVTVNVTSTATVQFINASSAGTLDVFVNGANRADNLAPQTGTAYDASVPAGDVTVEFRDQGGTTMASFSPRLDAGQRDIFVLIGGSGGQALQLMRATEAQPVPITPVVVASPGQVKKFVLHASVSIGTVDLFLLDIDNMRTKQLGANLSFGQTTGYDDVPADLTQSQIANTQGEIDVFRFPLNAFEGKVVTVIFTSNGSNSMFLVDSDGNEIGGQITTATEDEAGVPDQFALDGNYPNPFNPVTTIRFDLPQTAAVSVEVIDVLGRVVMTIPSQQYVAGAQHRLEVDASSLSSGMYLYRVIAEMETETQIRTGRMTLIK